ncbi:FkbM family methyltransferase [Pseudomonas sp. dw_358]|uniref:FkbM family methyltransferase n=1 Tax=Pseudomonas sp. dw_358 TaxID=2720083 RepID=UPI001C49FC9F|nr:FkbM family methyltransferase [Pseudomonas sp. dw_358]
MQFNYNSSTEAVASADYRKLQVRLAQAAAAYRDNPRFCVPTLACERLDAAGSQIKVVVLGVSPFAHIFFSQAQSRVHIVGVVDDFRAGTGETFYGCPFITSQDFEALNRREPIVAIHGCRTDVGRRYFKRLCLRIGVPVLSYEQSVRWLAIDPCTDARVADWGGYIVEHLESFAALSERLDDEYSRYTLYSVLLAHLTGDLEWTLAAGKPYSSLYFRSGLFTLGQNERFADCGASIAESTSAFLDATDGVFEKIWLIEPDEVNQKTLTTFIDTYRSQPSVLAKGEIELLKYAIADGDGEMPFLHEGGHNGHLLTAATGLENCRPVAIRRLDDILDQAPTLIKMDIEGAELGALKGASRYIAEARPRLAISAYHGQSDLLEIPRLIESLRGDYKIGLRHHTEDRWDTCLYFY